MNNQNRNTNRSHRMRKDSAENQAGVALITALLVVALASIAATAMLTANNIAIRRSSNIFQQEAAAWYLTGLEQWADQILRHDRQNNKVDDLNEVWAQGLPTLPIEGGSLTGKLIDLQGRFNLNSLAAKDNKAQKAAFQKLLGIALTQKKVQLKGGYPDHLANAVADWVDADKKTTYPGGAEDGYYLDLKHPYRAADTNMRSPSELLLVRGVTPEIYEALRPYITTLPNTTYSVNVNTAPWPVLAAEIPNMSVGQAQQCVQYRAKQPFKSTSAFLNQPACITPGKSSSFPKLSVQSQYFLAVGHAQVGDGRLTLYSLLHRQNNGLTHVIAHSRGVF